MVFPELLSAVLKFTCATNCMSLMTFTNYLTFKHLRLYFFSGYLLFWWTSNGISLKDYLVNMFMVTHKNVMPRPVESTLLLLMTHSFCHQWHQWCIISTCNIVNIDDLWCYINVSSMFLMFLHIAASNVPSTKHQWFIDQTSTNHQWIND